MRQKNENAIFYLVHVINIIHTIIIIMCLGKKYLLIIPIPYIFFSWFLGTLEIFACFNDQVIANRWLFLWFIFVAMIDFIFATYLIVFLIACKDYHQMIKNDGGYFDPNMMVSYQKYHGIKIKIWLMQFAYILKIISGILAIIIHENANNDKSYNGYLTINQSMILRFGDFYIIHVIEMWIFIFAFIVTSFWIFNPGSNKHVVHVV